VCVSLPEERSAPAHSVDTAEALALQARLARSQAAARAALGELPVFPARAALEALPESAPAAEQTVQVARYLQAAQRPQLPCRTSRKTLRHHLIAFHNFYKTY
jgi:hypothetical protein